MEAKKPPPPPLSWSKILATLVPVLLLMATWSTIQFFIVRADRSRLAAEKRGRIRGLPSVERARELVDRAEKYARLPNPDEDRLEDIQGMADEAVEAACDGLRRAPYFPVMPVFAWPRFLAPAKRRRRPRPRAAVSRPAGDSTCRSVNGFACVGLLGGMRDSRTGKLPRPAGGQSLASVPSAAPAPDRAPFPSRASSPTSQA